MIRGIGPVYAKKLVLAFGDAVFDIIQQEPRRLRGAGGRSASSQVGPIMLFLHSDGPLALSRE